MKISIFTKGDFRKTEKLLKKSLGDDYRSILDKYGRMGVESLSRFTPKDTGLTAASWRYRVIQNDDGLSVVWYNDNIVNGENIAILLQYGHGTRNGGYVVGRDYINPALQNIFDQLADAAWKEVTAL